MIYSYEYDNTSHVCRDVDECSEGACAGAAQCVNVPGGYECRCPAGYARGSHDACVDVDECADRDVCNHGTCRNTHGSFR